MVFKKYKEATNLTTNQRIISTALEVVTLASKPISCETLSSAYKQLNVTKSLLQIAETPNRNDFKFENTECNNEPSNKKIMKQVHYFPQKGRKSIKMLLKK